jgi:hypothetical protein
MYCPAALTHVSMLSHYFSSGMMLCIAFDPRRANTKVPPPFFPACTPNSSQFQM